MQYRNLGRSGLKISELSLGAWLTFGGQITNNEVAFQCMKSALDNGCNFFDNAESYAGGEAEVVMGKSIKRLGVKRSDLVISTKVFWGGKGPNDLGLSRKHVIEGLYASLKRLDLDYVDLLFCHRPDLNTPVEETVRAMNYLINQGKVFYWGTSEWPYGMIREAQEIARNLGLLGPLMEQPQYNMFHRTRVEKEYKPLYPDMGTTIWSPLASGLLTGKYSKDVEKFPKGSRLTLQDKNSRFREQLLSGVGVSGLEEKNFDDILSKINRLRNVAEDIGCSMSQLALAWCLKNENVSSVITGASKPEQVVENFKSVEFVPKMTPAITEKIENILQNNPKVPIAWVR